MAFSLTLLDVSHQWPTCKRLDELQTFFLGSKRSIAMRRVTLPTSTSEPARVPCQGGSWDAAVFMSIFDVLVKGTGNCMIAVGDSHFGMLHSFHWQHQSRIVNCVLHGA